VFIHSLRQIPQKSSLGVAGVGFLQARYPYPYPTNSAKVHKGQGPSPWGRAHPVNFNNKMFEKSNWYSLLGVNAATICLGNIAYCTVLSNTEVCGTLFFR